MKIIVLLWVIMSISSVGFTEAYQIRFGDLVNVTMTEDERVKFNGEVSTAGFVTLPYFGPTRIAGMTEVQAESQLKKQLETGLYQIATVSVIVLKRAVGYVYVYGSVSGTGESTSSGKVEVPADKGTITVLQAIAEVGGLSMWADPKLAKVLLYNKITKKYNKKILNLDAAYQNIGGKDNLTLSPDDIVVIPSVANGKVSPGAIQVMVAGKVKSPGVVLFKPGEPPSLVRAILKAGNFNKFANKSKVRLMRMEGGVTTSQKIDVEELLKEGKLTNDIQLKSGDLIVIDETWY